MGQPSAMSWGGHPSQCVSEGGTCPSPCRPRGITPCRTLGITVGCRGECLGIIWDLWDIRETAIEAAICMSWMLGRSDGDKLAIRGIKRFNPAA